MRALRRWWCRRMHGPDALMVPGGPLYECRRCGEKWEVSWLDGPAPRYPLPQVDIDSPSSPNIDQLEAEL